MMSLTYFPGDPVGGFCVSWREEGCNESQSDENTSWPFSPIGVQTAPFFDATSFLKGAAIDGINAINAAFCRISKFVHSLIDATNGECRPLRHR